MHCSREEIIGSARGAFSNPLFDLSDDGIPLCCAILYIGGVEAEEYLAEGLQMDHAFLKLSSLVEGLSLRQLHSFKGEGVGIESETPNLLAVHKGDAGGLTEE